MMPSPFRRHSPLDERTLRREADDLERSHGWSEAVKMIRSRIAEADREERRRLYRLHDEIVRRH